VEDRVREVRTEMADSLAEKLGALEQRLDGLETLIQDEVARQAAQIIREEIAALAEELDD
ncbi:MAG: hypothetical protein AB7D51_04540, partial [Desulfovibrionaceae bacterium]